MPTAKKPRKSRSAAPKNQYTAELSSSQLVMGITILMIFGLACFLLGVLIGKFDPSLRPEQQFAKSSPEHLLTDVELQPTPNPAQNTVGKKTPTKSAPAKKLIEEKHIVVPARPTSKPPTQPTAKLNKPVTPVVPAAKIPESATSANAPAAEPKVSIPKNTPQKPVIEEIHAANVEEPKKVQPPVAPAKPPSSSASSSRTQWAVQIAAFKSSASAEAERKRLESTLPFQIDILKRSSDTWNRLLIGRYTAKPEANLLRQELIDKHGRVEPFLVIRNP